jgi:hypothetical protein
MSTQYEMIHMKEEDDCPALMKKYRREEKK